MKHVKTFEGKRTEEQCNNIALYLEDMLSMSEKDIFKNGFIECLWSEDPFELNFYFKDWADEEVYEKFYKFLEDQQLKVYKETTYEQNKNYSNYVIIIRPNREQLRKLMKEVEMWYDAKKYNL